VIHIFSGGFAKKNKKMKNNDTKYISFKKKMKKKIGA